MKPNLGKKPYREKAALNFIFFFSLLVWKQAICIGRIRALTFTTGGEVDCQSLIFCSVSLFALALCWVGIS